MGEFWVIEVYFHHLKVALTDICEIDKLGIAVLLREFGEPRRQHLLLENDYVRGLDVLVDDGAAEFEDEALADFVVLVGAQALLVGHVDEAGVPRQKLRRKTEDHSLEYVALKLLEDRVDRGLGRREQGPDQVDAGYKVADSEELVVFTRVIEVLGRRG